MERTRYDSELLEHRIEEELRAVVRRFDLAPFSSLPNQLLTPIKAFFLRKGKRLRPKLFLLTNSAYASHEAEDLYKAAAGLELLHDFILIHDDIIDDSDLRREKSSMHSLLRDRIAAYNGKTDEAKHLAMTIGDMVYALAIQLFTEVDAPSDKKIEALRELTEAALYTASGEMRELLNSLQPLEELTAQAIRETLQWKTAHYSFVCPMVTGAILAGAAKDQTELIRRFGLLAGLAYQIRDDIADILGGEERCDLEDIRDGRQTMPLWYALENTQGPEHDRLLSTIRKQSPDTAELKCARATVISSGGLDYAHREMMGILEQAQADLMSLAIDRDHKDRIWFQLEPIFDMQRNPNKEYVS